MSDKKRKLMNVVWISLSVSFLVILPQLTWSQSDPLSDYGIGEIPPQTVWYDRPVEFQVHSATLGSGATIDAKIAYGVAEGVMEWDLATNTFRYVLGENDKEPFSVEFSATFSGETEAQTVNFYPMQKIDPEETVIDSGGNVWPDPESMDYILKNEIESKEPEDFNNLNRITRRVSISGNVLVFQEGHSNGLYNYNDNEDIKEMSIYADTVIIKSPLRLPQTNVAVYARELIFEDPDGATESACIDTTPMSLDTRPAQFEDGKHGLTGGDITIFVDAFESIPDSAVRLISNGGNGQPAGLGSDGADGDSMDSKEMDGGKYKGVVYEKYKKEKRCCIIECFPCGWPEEWEHWGQKAWPGDGKDAVPGGKPGNGGSGGTISSNINIDAYSNYTGGVAGEEAGIFKGGAGGEPSNAIWIEHKRYWDYDHDYWVIDSHTSSPGNDVTSPSASIPVGSDGNFRIGGHSLSWFHPYALRSVLSYGKDAYLNGFMDEARETFRQFMEIIDAYELLPEWNELPDEDRKEFVQVRHEMMSLVHRIDSNFDYFGNPAGWVPMLSFEVTRAAYENEIDKAIRALYLTYWINNASASLGEKIEALSTAKSQLKEEVEYLKSRYSTATELIPGLQSKASEISNKITLLKSQIQTLEQELLAKAKDNLEDKTPFWKQAASILGAACSMLPVGQPIVGTIGKGLTILSNLDNDDPWSTITDLSGIAEEFSEENFAQAAESFDAFCQQIDLGSVNDHDSFVSYLEGLEPYKKSMDEIIQKVNESIGKTEVPKNELEAEFERLKANSPEFLEMTDRVKSLLAEKEFFINRLNDVIQSTVSLSNSITQNILSVDKFNVELAESFYIDHSVKVHMDEMERRARERLLKYHYYMAKAYEYRLLKPYDTGLDLSRFYDKCREIAERTSDEALTFEDFNALKAIYEEPLSNTAETILDIYMANRPELSVPVRFELPADKMEKLNNGETITVNLMEMGLFQPSEENIRIVSLEVEPDHTEIQSVRRSFGYVDIFMEHSGISKLRVDGENYLFRHYNDNTENPIVWGARCDKYGITNQIVPSPRSDSLLKSLLGNASDDDNLLIYSRPSAWADIYIRKEVNSDDASDIVFTKLVFKLVYDFMRKDSSIKLLNVKTSNEGFLPHIALSQNDLNGRQDGRGSFSRTFDRGQTVQLKAPSYYGNWEFDGWTDKNGNLLPRGGLNSREDRTIDVLMDQDMSIIANYSPVYEDLDNDELPDWWEQSIINAEIDDDIVNIYDVMPDADFDNDGYSNLIEYKHNLDPVAVNGFLRGDVNMDFEITPQDARDAFHLSLKEYWTESELNRADYNQDGEITPQDARDIFNASF